MWNKRRSVKELFESLCRREVLTMMMSHTRIQTTRMSVHMHTHTHTPGSESTVQWSKTWTGLCCRSKNMPEALQDPQLQSGRIHFSTISEHQLQPFFHIHYCRWEAQHVLWNTAPLTALLPHPLLQTGSSACTVKHSTTNSLSPPWLQATSLAWSSQHSPNTQLLLRHPSCHLKKEKKSTLLFLSKTSGRSENEF